jgi:fatty-acyl-CoA synthase
VTELLKDWVDRHARSRPQAVALAQTRAPLTLTWAELEDRVAHLAGALSDLGIGKTDRVALLAENDIRCFEVQFACMRLGAVLVPLSWRLTPTELREQLGEAAPTLVIHDIAWGNVARHLAQEAGIPTLEWGNSTSAYEQALSTASRPRTGGELDPDAVTQILFTSGTTGQPKGVLCTNRTLATQAYNLAHTSRMAERGGHHLNTVPLFHAGGLNVFCNPMLFWGGRVTTTARFDPADTLDLLSDSELGVTHLCGVLQMYERITALPSFGQAVLPKLTTVLFGGWGPSAATVYEAWAKRGIAVQLSYGASELGPNVSILTRPDADAARRGTSGSIVPHTAVRLMGPDGTDVAPGTTGEIQVRGPAVTPGYWKHPDDDVLSAGWFRTGDAGRFGEDGDLYVVGRIKEMYRSGGENIYPAEVEAVLSRAPRVAEIAVLGIPDTRWGEAGLAAVVPDPGAEITLASLRTFAADKLARFKLPTALLVLDALPRSATDKVSRQQVRELWAQQKVANGPPRDLNTEEHPS